MRNLLFAAIAAAVCGGAHADTMTFIPLATPGVQISKISANGAYVSGGIYDTAAFRWTASTGAEELITDMNAGGGINDSGTLTGSVPIDGGSNNGGDDLGAYAKVGAAPVQLVAMPDYTNADGYDIAADGTIVGLAFNHGFIGNAAAFVWTTAAGMSALPVNRPANYSRANVISADGHVIAGWNDQDDGGRTAVVWRDRVPLDLLDPNGNAVGEADGISGNGRYVVGSGFLDPDSGEVASWRWNSTTGDMVMIPHMAYAFGVTDDGHTVVGANGFFDDPPRAALIWQEGVGTQLLTDYLAAKGVTVPDGWDPGLAGSLGAISADGSLMGGWSFGPSGYQSYLVRTVTDNIFADGFDGVPPKVSKSFVPASIVAQGAPSTLTIVLDNPAAVQATLTADFVDSFPAGLTVAATPAASTSCGGTVVASAGSGSVTLKSGATIPAQGYCKIIVAVGTDASGDYANIIPSGALATDQGVSAAAATASLHVIPPGNNGIVHSAPLNHDLQDNGNGSTLNMISGVIDDAGPYTGPWDINFYDNGDIGLVFYGVPTYGAAVATDAGGNALVMHAGDVVGPGTSFASEATSPAWLAGTDGYLGVRFKCDGRQTYPVATTFCYGYIHVTTTAASGYPATLVDYAYDGDGNAITIAP